MCTITGKYEGETFTGYKHAYKKDGKYYSVWTGIEYKPGKVKRPKPVDDKKSFLCADGIVRTVEYTVNMTGMTGVLKNKSFAIKDSFDTSSNILLEMTIKGNLQEGSLYELEFGVDSLVIGNTIVSIKEIKAL